MQIYNTVAYARASKDDVDSSTIENQLELIKDYAKSIPEIRIISMMEDNGFSGIDFLRPSFEKIMEDIKVGKINCIIVKDLSRLGRNYIEVGELMEDIFPKYGVRLIAINDHYDSIKPNTESEDIIIPFKNLINEQYLRDFSVKIRSNLSVKRKKGEHVSAFAPYGYIRDSKKRKLVIDDHAAKMVQNIFKWKIEGMSQQGIADRLSELGEPAPADYKQTQGSSYKTPLQIYGKAKWSAVAISRILHNPVYIGTLEQGKRTTPNYKVKKTVYTPEEEWSVTENAHEAIINKSDFEIVNSLLSQDIRIAPQNDTVFPLSGVLFCADCGNTMVRKKAGKYTYYVCGTNKNGNGCTSHTVSQIDLENAIMEAITNQIATILNIEESLQFLRSLPLKDRNVQIANEQIAIRENELRECEKYRRFLYEDYKNKEISKEDYDLFRKEYTERINMLNQAIEKIKQETELLLNSEGTSNIWVEHFMQYKNVKECTRSLITNLIVRIDVYEQKRIDIEYRYQDKFLMSMDVINAVLEKNKDTCHSTSDAELITNVNGGNVNG